MIIASVAALFWLTTLQAPVSMIGQTYGQPEQSESSAAPVTLDESAVDPAREATRRSATVDSEVPQPTASGRAVQFVRSEMRASASDRPPGGDMPSRPPDLAEFGYTRLVDVPPMAQPEPVLLLAAARDFVDRYREPDAWHRSLTGEPSDPAWGDTMAENIRAYFGDGRLPAGFQPIEVECRTAICMLQAFANEYGAQHRFSSAVQTLRQQHWAQSIERRRLYFNLDGGTTTVLVFLERGSSSTPPEHP